MGFFAKKADPFSKRARALNQEIAALQSQIERLSAQQEKAARQRQAPPAPARNGAKRSPRTNRAQRASAGLEPVFEEFKGKPLAAEAKPARAEQFNELKVAPRKSSVSATLRRFVKRFQAAPPANPKLVNYLAAGSIQGLRPLRYEKRVARNRFVFLMVFLVLLLLGILTSFVRH